MQAVAVILSDDKPEDGLHFKDNRMGGCVAAMLVAASKKNRLAYFDRNSYSCPGGGTGLGFGDCYGQFPIDCLLSTGNMAFAEKMGKAGALMEEGERFYENPKVARNWVNSVPMTDVPTNYVVFKPWNLLAADDKPEMIIFFVNPDQLSALVVMADYSRGMSQSVIAPFCAACQSILFGYEEAQQEKPRGIIGFFDIAVRSHVDRDMLTFTAPYALFQEMERNVEESFLKKHAWEKLQERQ
ncbi:COG2043 family uncharacterized protein [Mangrovibacterium marinum]|uniref:COG2043 family uncharacterized protein n=2 Tax=Mangrovibacterium marinum TaxID=1639118 RepID=A0A2T5BZF2_9BACT|nr:COG2043 family uncharacterized protein [Mangrovibacterium marinum]